jgi:hypothetical protein
MEADGANVDVRSLSDVYVPPGSYLLHVTTIRAHVSSSPPAIDCGSSPATDGAIGTMCDVPFPAGTRVILNSTGYAEFCGWGGACSASSTPDCAVVMDSDKSVSIEYIHTH